MIALAIILYLVAAYVIAKYALFPLAMNDDKKRLPTLWNDPRERERLSNTNKIIAMWFGFMWPVTFFLLGIWGICKLLTKNWSY